MEWPREIYPQKTKYALIEALRKMKFRYVIGLLFLGYMSINLLFFGLYYLDKSLDNDIFVHSNEMINTSQIPQNTTTDSNKPASDSNKPASSFDYVINYLYFSFVTGLTIGFGDLKPYTNLGKCAVIIHGMVSTFYFAMMIAFLGVKMLFPTHTLHFSKKILFDGKQFMFRIFNSHRGLFVNPEIRVGMVVHCYGNCIAPTISVKKMDDLYWLDNHDFTFSFSDNLGEFGTISSQWKAAKEYCGQEKSRFKIRISITGSYGLQQYTQVVSYGKDDIVHAKNFEAISYSDEDNRIWRNIRLNKFGNFWDTFDAHI